MKKKKWVDRDDLESLGYVCLFGLVIDILVFLISKEFSFSFIWLPLFVIVGLMVWLPMIYIWKMFPYSVQKFLDKYYGLISTIAFIVFAIYMFLR